MGHLRQPETTSHIWTALLANFKNSYLVFNKTVPALIAGSYYDIYIYTYIHRYIHTYIHTYIHIYIYILYMYIICVYTISRN